MTAVDVRSARDQADGTRRVGQGERGRDVHVIFWGSAALMTVAAIIRNGYVFSSSQYPYSDQALNTLLVDRAEKFEQLVGNYSRVGFHHPGPALIYFLSWGQGLFHDALHIVPSEYNGQLLAAILYGAVFTAFTLVCLYRLTGSRGAAAVAFGIAFGFAARFHMLGDTWFPFMYMPAFLLFTVAGAAVAIGSTAELPLYVLGAGVLAHGHVSFLLFVAVTTLVVVAGWWWRHHANARAELRAHRRALWGSGVLLFLFALPLALESILHYPGQWPDYWHYARYGQRTPRTFGQILDFMGKYWTVSAIPIGLSIAAIALAIVLTATERDSQRRRVFLGLYGFVVLQSTLTFYYVARGVDALTRTNIYVAFFYMTVPLVLVLAAAAQLWIRLASRAATAPRIPRGGVVGVAIAAFVALSLFAATQTAFTLKQEPKAGFPAVVSALRDDPARDGRTIELVLDQHDTWPAGAGVAAELARTGTSWCIRDDFNGLWSVLFDSSNVCRSDGGARWQVHITLREPAAPDARVLASTFEGRTPVAVYDLPGRLESR